MADLTITSYNSGYEINVTSTELTLSTETISGYGIKGDKGDRGEQGLPGIGLDTANIHITGGTISNVILSSSSIDGGYF